MIAVENEESYRIAALWVSFMRCSWIATLFRGDSSSSYRSVRVSFLTEKKKTRLDYPRTGLHCSERQNQVPSIAGTYVAIPGSDL